MGTRHHTALVLGSRRPFLPYPRVAPPLRRWLPAPRSIPRPRSVRSHDQDGIHWAASDLIGAVIVKGGTGANAYVYEGGEFIAGGLNPPANPMTGLPYGISHVTFCWSPEDFLCQAAQRDGRAAVRP